MCFIFSITRGKTWVTIILSIQDKVFNHIIYILYVISTFAQNRSSNAMIHHYFQIYTNITI